MKKKSALLLFLSERKNGAKEAEYEYQGKKYKGEQTNDAPFHCLFDVAEEGITKVLCLVSRKVYYEKSLEDNCTMFERYQEMVKEKNKDIEVVPIPYNFSLDDIEKVMTSQEQAVNIYQEIAKQLDEEYDIYVDFTGGMRDATFLMTTIIRYLEFKGNHCKKVIYSYFNFSDNSKNKIYSIDYIYNLFQMVNGVSEFISTGNVTQFMLAFREDSSIGNNREIRELLNSLQDFSQTISLCDLSRLDSVLQNLEYSLQQFESSDSDNIQSAMLKSMIPEIKKRMYMEEGEKLSYANLILWCVENRLLQQALTLYTEKIPVYYMEKNYYPEKVLQMGEEAEAKKKLKLGETKEVNLLYTQFFQYLLSEGEEKSPATKLKRELEKKEEEFQPIKDFSIINWQKKWEEEIKSQIKRANDEELKKAWEELLKALKHYQNPTKNRKPKFLLKEKAPKSFDKCINAVITNPKVLFNDSDKMEIKNSTYKNKMLGLENLTNRKLFSEEEEQKYKKVLSYYFAVKMVRNHVNHANGVTGTQDLEEDGFKEAMLWLKEKAEIEINFDETKQEVKINFDDIMNLLRRGVEESKKIVG